MLLPAESLWEEDFNSYGTGQKLLRPGSIINVTIDSETTLTFSSSGSGDRELVLTFSGGETGDLFSFLPEIQSMERSNLEGEEEISLKTSLAARVQETNSAGMSLVQGTRTLVLKNSVQALTVSGWCDPKKVDAAGNIPFEHLAEGRLTYRTLLEPEEEILREEDIISGLTDPGTEEAGEAADEEATGEAADAGGEMTLTEERKKELLLQYVNRFVDLIFDN